MDAYDRLLIEIYRAAREAPLSDFREIALEAIKPVVPFDTASWGIVRFAPEGVIVDGGYLYRLPDSMIAEHAQVQHCEPTVPIERLADPVVLTFCWSDPQWSRAELAPFQAYLKRHDKANALNAVMREAATGQHASVSLFRKDRRRRFRGDERALMQRLLPHLVEAYVSCEAHELAKPRLSSASEYTAFATVDWNGHLHARGAGFGELIAEEWPHWTGRELPAALRARLGAASAEFVGARIKLRVDRANGVVFVSARRRSPMDQLSARERAVAELIAAGLPYKRIALELGIAPDTARNHTRSIYGKLGVNSKGQFIRLLQRHSAPVTSS